MAGSLRTYGCPGAASLKSTPTLTEKTCPVCGSIIEIFSTDTHVACDNCGFIAYNDTQNCLEWCPYAKDCVGEEIYNKFMEAKRTVNEQSSKL